MKKIFALGVLIVLLFSCKDGGSYKHAYYLEGIKNKKDVLKELFKLLDDKNAGGKDAGGESFLIVREIANQYESLNDHYKMINFLSDWVNRHPQDKYNSYYLLRTADAYIKKDSPEIARLYFELIVKNHADLIVRGKSIHLICLENLIRYTANPVQKIWYYEKLIKEFPDKIDLGVSYFMLGRAEEEIGAWEKSIEAYKNLLPYYDTVVPGFVDAYSYSRQLVDFYNIEKNLDQQSKLNRTFESLPALLKAVKSALDSGNTLQLWNYRSRVNFFARSWSQIGGIDDEASDLNLSSFYTTQNLSYSDTLSDGSNSSDAYLKTWGWSKLTNIWYFYFRKIYFPMDPEIHGRWEWAGIYYGERF